MFVVFICWKTTKRAIRENITISAKLTDMSDKTSEILSENTQLAKSEKAVKRQVELLAMAEQELAKKSQSSKKIIKMLLDKINGASSTRWKGSCLKAGETLLEKNEEVRAAEKKQYETKLNTITSDKEAEIERLTADVQQLQQELNATLEDESSGANRKSRYNAVLAEATRLLVRAIPEIAAEPKPESRHADAAVDPALLATSPSEDRRSASKAHRLLRRLSDEKLRQEVRK